MIYVITKGKILCWHAYGSWEYYFMSAGGEVYFHQFKGKECNKCKRLYLINLYNSDWDKLERGMFNFYAITNHAIYKDPSRNDTINQFNSERFKL